MKRLYQLLALSMVASCYPSFAQVPKARIQKNSALVPGNLLAWQGGKTQGLRADITLADVTVSGRVSDEKGGTLPGVSVVLKGSTQGTTTDGEGHFKMSVPNGNAVLVFSFVGYQKQELAVGNQTTLNITLSPDDQTLNEVVVVGYGSQLKKEIT